MPEIKLEKVTIPTWANPFPVTVNGKTYYYPAGETLEVPYEVAEVIRQLEHDPSLPPSSGGGGTGGGGADVLNENGIIKQEHLPEGYPYNASGFELIFPETEAEFDEGDGMFIIGEGLEAEMFTNGESYIVNWNGVDYTCSALAMSNEGMSAIVLGDLYAMEGNPITGEPFVVLIYTAATQADMGIAAHVMPFDGSESVIISISGESEPTPIAPKFLPKGYPYFAPGGTVLLEETTVIPQGMGAPMDFSLELIEGRNYTVVCNGAAYEVKCYPIYWAGSLIAFIGNPVLVQSNYQDNQMPFAIITAMGSTFLLGDSSDPMTLSITEADTYVKPDPNYSLTEFVDIYGTISSDANGAGENITYRSHSNPEIISMVQQGKNVILRYYTMSSGDQYFFDCFHLASLKNDYAIFSHASGGQWMYRIIVRMGSIRLEKYNV